jgi:transcription-repair coupling factor (superfamily II helicase)
MAKKTIFNFEALGRDYAKMLNEIRAGNSCSIFGIQNSMRPAICNSLDKKILFISADNVTASSKVEEFELMGLKTLYFPAVQDSFLFKKAQSNEFSLGRTLTLFKILQKDFDVVVLPITALFSFLPNLKEFKQHILKLKVNQEITIEKLERLLVESGYKKEELISSEGQFSKRGEIVDVFPIGASHPYRIDFFDTVIETIKILVCVVIGWSMVVLA